MEPKPVLEFQQHIATTFSDISLLQTALTHRSYVNEYRGGPIEHNERLEFLGDAVLELVVTDFLYKKFPDKPEGDLTSYRAALVNTNTLSEAATKLGANEYLRLSKGESRDTGRARQFILANAFEAIIGALYLDQGYAAAHSFIDRTILPLTDDMVQKRLWQDAKSRFQEVAQERVSVTPSYQLLLETGPDHDKLFRVGVFLNDECVAHGEGKSKQEAEQQAAANGLLAKEWE
jgi:ribonuclease III